MSVGTLTLDSEEREASTEAVPQQTIGSHRRSGELEAIDVDEIERR